MKHNNPGRRLAIVLTLFVAYACWPHHGQAYPGLFLPEEARAGFAELGYDVPNALIDRVRRATACVASSRGMGSGTFVTPDLLLTAGHVLVDSQHAAGRDFAATSRAEEPILPGVGVLVPLTSTDVTAEIEAAICELVANGMAPLAAEKAACAQLGSLTSKNRKGCLADVGPDPRNPTKYAVQLSTVHPARLVLLAEPGELDLAVLRVELSWTDRTSAPLHPARGVLAGLSIPSRFGV